MPAVAQAVFADSRASLPAPMGSADGVSMQATPGFARSTALGISFRPIVPTDDELVYQIYARTRTEELAPVPWSAAQKETFLRSQSHAQNVHYAKHYADAGFDIILAHGAPCGRLVVARTANEFRVIDIALLPAFRGRGFGAAILNDLFDQARGAGVCVTIHVEHSNPARRLYQRLGFQVLSDEGIYLQMQWSPVAMSTGLIDLQ